MRKNLERRFAGEFLGTVQAVLFEQETENGFAEGYTDRYLRIHAAGTPGGFQNVLLKKYNDAILYGDIIK